MRPEYLISREDFGTQHMELRREEMELCKPSNSPQSPLTSKRLTIVIFENRRTGKEVQYIPLAGADHNDGGSSSSSGSRSSSAVSKLPTSRRSNKTTPIKSKRPACYQSPSKNQMSVGSSSSTWMSNVHAESRSPKSAPQRKSTPRRQGSHSSRDKDIKRTNPQNHVTTPAPAVQEAQRAEKKRPRLAKPMDSQSATPGPRSGEKRRKTAPVSVAVAASRSKAPSDVGTSREASGPNPSKKVRYIPPPPSASPAACSSGEEAPYSPISSSSDTAPSPSSMQEVLDLSTPRFDSGTTRAGIDDADL